MREGMRWIGLPLREIERWRNESLLGIRDEGEDHAVEVVEEADKIEAKLDEADFLVR